MKPGPGDLDEFYAAVYPLGGPVLLSRMNFPGGWELLIVLLIFLAVAATLGFVVWFAVRQGTKR